MDDALSDEDREVQGEEFEGEDAEQPVRQVVSLLQELAPSDSGSKKKAKGKRKKPPPPIRINLTNCKYEVLRIVQRKLGWKEVGDEEDWEIYWTDTSVCIERIMKLTRIQKINHFSGMLEICRKRAMARNLMKMARMFPQHYDFFPRTFILPGDKEDFLADVRARGKKQVYILKPDAGCQGKGIRLVQGGKDEVVARVLNEMATPNVVAQHYLSSPLLLHGYKFDLRLYALVLSCDPLRIFLFHEGLARICTEKYSPPKASNLDVSFMHLTNYSVNKKNEAFMAAAANADSGEDASKWTLAQLRHYLVSLGHDWAKVWGDIGDLIVKSLCSVQPVLRNNYRSVLPPDNDGFSCFEVLGYDIMLDDSLRPWLIEVNHSPSFNIDSPLDLAIKEELITQTMELVRVDPKIIAKVKKAERRAATSRLLEPMHAKKATAAAAAAAAGPAGARASAPPGSGSGAGAQADIRDRERTGNGDGEEGGSGGGSGPPSVGFVKPRTPEEYEAWRAKVLSARERYEAKHSGNFTRIFPSPDPAKQALYEELLKGASEIYQASFQARSKRLEAAEEKKRKEDAETDAQKAERLKARAHRDRLAQMAVERRKVKLLQQQAAQGVQLLPAYLLPPPQPYLQPSQLAAQQQQQQGQPQGQQQLQHPMYYVPLMPSGPYQYDPSVYQQYYQYQQQAYLYGGAVAAGGGGGPRLPSEVYGERSDGGGSVASSRPVSAISSSSHVALDPLAPLPGQALDPRGPPRVQVGPVARAVSSASREQRAASPAAAAAGSGQGSPMGLSGCPPAGGLAHAVPQQVLLQFAHGHGHGHAHQQPQQPTQHAMLLLQHQQQLAHLGQQHQTFTQQQQTQGALPPNPFLGGGSSRRPSSATSRTSTGCGGAGAGVSGAAGVGGGVGPGGDVPDGAAAFAGRGSSTAASGGGAGASLSHSAPSAAAVASGAAASGAALAGSRLLSGGASGGNSFSHGHATPVHYLQQQSPVSAGGPAGGAAGAAGGAAPQPQPVRAVPVPVPVGSAHNHIRHVHGSPAEAAGAALAAGDGLEKQDTWKGERDHPSGPAPGPGPGPGAGPGPGRCALPTGSRPPSASSLPASIRDKLQPNPNPGAGAAGAPAANTVGGAGGAGSAGAAPGLVRKQSVAEFLNNSAAAAAATWDAAMAAAAAASGQDPDIFSQYFGARPRPRSAGQGLRPTSAGAGGAPRSPSPLVAPPPSAAALVAALAALSGTGVPCSTSASGAAGRHGSERPGTAGADVFMLGLTHALGLSQAPPSPPHQSSRQFGSSPQIAGGGGGAGGGAAGGSPKLMRSSSSSYGPPSPMGIPPLAGYSGPSGVTAGSLSGAGGSGGVAGTTREPGVPTVSVPATMSSGLGSGRAYKQTRSPGTGRHPGLAAVPAGAAGAAHAGRLRGDEDVAAAGGGEDGGLPATPSPLVYQPLVMPDSVPGPAERKAGAAPGSGRHWSAASPAGAGAPQGSARQRSFNTGPAGSYVTPTTVVSAVAAVAGGGSGGGAGGGGGAAGNGVVTSRPPVYPPPGGSPGLRAGGAPASGRVSGGGAGGGGGALSGKVGGTAAAAGRLNSGYGGGFSGTGAFGGGGGVMVRSVGGVGAASGSANGVSALQDGFEGLHVTATGVEMNAQLRTAALAALNRKGLAVKGRKVAQS